MNMENWLLLVNRPTSVVKIHNGNIFSTGHSELLVRVEITWVQDLRGCTVLNMYKYT